MNRPPELAVPETIHQAPANTNDRVLASMHLSQLPVNTARALAITADLKARPLGATHRGAAAIAPNRVLVNTPRELAGTTPPKWAPIWSRVPASSSSEVNGKWLWKAASPCDYGVSCGLIVLYVIDLVT